MRLSFLFIHGIAACSAATVTLQYGIDPTAASWLSGAPNPSNSVTVIPIGTGSDGPTTYREEVAASVVIDFYGDKTPTATKTSTTSVWTFQATIVEDATHLSYHQDANPTGNEFGRIGVDEECQFDGKGGAVCVQKEWSDRTDSAGREFETWTTTFTGYAVPWYTLEVKGNSAGPLARRRQGVEWAAIALVVGGMFLGTLLIV